MNERQQVARVIAERLLGSNKQMEYVVVKPRYKREKAVDELTREIYDILCDIQIEQADIQKGE